MLKGDGARQAPERRLSDGDLLVFGTDRLRAARHDEDAWRVLHRGEQGDATGEPIAGTDDRRIEGVDVGRSGGDVDA
jgi:hypothetical protein